MWKASESRVWRHPKFLRMRASEHYVTAVALWELAGCYCADDPKLWITGHVPAEAVHLFGIPNVEAGIELLLEVNLWEADPPKGWTFHDWHDWNGPDAAAHRGKEQTRIRVHGTRLRKCQAGTHSKDCPTTDLDGEPWKCPRRAERDTGPGNRVAARSATPVSVPATASASASATEKYSATSPDLPVVEAPRCSDCGWPADSTDHYAACEPRAS